jgi:diguanylate cyclase (GGDEF)-like protein/PAS domain S-box-containing protein
MTRTPIRQLRIQLMTAVAVIMVLIWGAVAYQLSSQRDAALRVATQQGQNLSSVVAEHFSSYAASVDLLLKHLRIQWTRDPKHFAGVVALERRLRNDIFLVQISVIDAQGWLAYTDLANPKERLFLGDREHFKAHRSSVADQLYISNPLKGRVSGNLSIQFTRPIFDKKEKFSGVLVLSVSPEALFRVYGELDLGSNGIVALRRLDNTLLMRWPAIDMAQQTQFPAIPPSAPGAADVGSFIGEGSLDGVERIFSFRRIPDFPLYAVVGQSLDAVLAESGKERRVYLAAGSLGSLVVLLFGFVMLSKLKREERVESELIKSEARFRSLTELSSDMYWEQDDQYRFTSSSGSGPDWVIKGRSRAIGNKRWEVNYLNMTEKDWAAHIALLDARRPFHDLELCRFDDSGRKVWINVSGEPVFDESGAFKGYRGVGKDITDRKRAEQLQALEHAVNRSLADADNATAAVQAAIRAICETEGWECGRYFRWDETGGVLRLSNGWGIPDKTVQQFLAKSSELSYAPGVGLAGKVWQSRQPLWATDITQDARVDQVALARGMGMRGAFVFPVISEGNAIGVLAFNSREVREPEDRLMQAISVIGSQIGQFLQRKQREEELRRFRTAMDVSEDMIWLIDPVRMSVIDVNDTACRKLGYGQEELLRIAPQDIISMSGEELSGIYDRLIQGGEGDTAVGWYRRKDGSRFPVEAFRRAVQSEGSHVIVAVVRDVTQRRAAEEELRRFRLAMDNSADMIVLIDRTTMRFVDVNETACRLLGYSREELLEMGPQDVLPVTREELERSYDKLIARPSGNTGLLLSGMKSQYVCKDGTLLPFESTRHVLRSGDTTIIAAISRDIRARLAIEEKVAYMAQFDALTGLPNRNLFQDRLVQAMALAKRNHWPMAVLFIDLDRFKRVNDTLGHGAGDNLLKEAAERLRSCVRSSDTVGRLGGDEFAVILSELGKPGDAGLVAQKIIDIFKRPFDLEGKETYVTASVGVALYPADSDNAGSLVVNADAAMYRAKEQGRNNYQYFTRDMNERALQRVQMEAALRRALEREEFRLFYQPKADLVTGKICGFEALLRWQHPDKGMVLPGDFIPVLEETGLIVQAGEWVLRTACAQIKAWQETALKVPPISVNLSARQFEQKNLNGAVRQILLDTKVDPSLIEFEITESLLMNDPERAARTLHSLKEAGVRLSMDDFGTGYSSLGYLKRFPIDTLKIDRTFVRDISTDADDATLTRAIINLAQNLRLKVVAEGVETEAQLAFLCSNGCDEMQGYLFAKPTHAEACERMLREGQKLPIPRAGRKEKSGAQPKRVHA